MPKQLLEINDFWWIIHDATKQVTNGFFDVFWIDLYSEDWVAQINRSITWTEDAVITEIPISFTVFDDKLIVWAANEKIYYDNGTIFTTLWTNTNSGDNNDIIVYQKFLVFSSESRLGISNDYTVAGWLSYNPTWASWWPSFDNDYPFHIFNILNNRLYISDWNKIAELDGASDPTTPSNWILDTAKFILPEDEVILSMEWYGTEMAIGTEKWNIYIWDWVSTNATDIIYGNYWKITAMIQFENMLLVCAWTSWVIYYYNGSDLVPFVQVPQIDRDSNTYIHLRGIIRYKTGVLFLIPNNGIYIYARNKQNRFVLTKYGSLRNWLLPTEVSNLNCVILTDVEENFFYIWYTYSWDERVDTVDDSLSNYYYLMEPTSWNISWWPYLETQVYELRGRNGKKTKVQWIQAMFSKIRNIGGSISNRILVKYRLDNDLNYTTLWEIGLWWLDEEQILRGIGKQAEKVQFRIYLWQTFWSNARNTKLTHLKVF